MFWPIYAIVILLICRKPDPAASAACVSFAFSSASAVAQQYSIPVEQVQLLQRYLLYLASTFAAPAFKASVLGPLLGSQSGGLVVSRSLQTWLDGMPAAQQSIACP